MAAKKFYDSVFFLRAASKERVSVSTYSAVSSSSSSVVNEEKCLHAVIACKTGFMASIGSGRVAVCELVTPLKELLAEDDIHFRGT